MKNTMKMKNLFKFNIKLYLILNKYLILIFKLKIF